MNNIMKLLSASAMLLAAATGCIQRTLQIETDPPGANVWVNGENVGKTPAELPFLTYGSIEVFMQMEGHATRKEVVRLRPPWYAVFPIDFFTDVLYPGTLHDRKTFGFKLDRPTPPDLEALRSRGEEFRDNARELLARERRKRGIALPAKATTENKSTADSPAKPAPTSN